MATDPHVETHEVDVELPGAALPGFLWMPANSRAVVLFAHGSGSSRFSSRNQLVAESLNRAGLSTLLFDLLTPEEHELDQRTRELRFDIELLAKRLAGAVDWVVRYPATESLAVGLFGASTGAAAALVAAAARPIRVGAVVSRGGRPDLAAAALERVEAPTLLIVGGLDDQVIQMNEWAAARMHAPRQLEIVPGATHLFEEPGKLQAVAALTGDWFVKHLSP